MGAVPDSVLKEMDIMLGEALVKARRMALPGDGYAVNVESRIVAGGMWTDSGWDLEAQLVEDIRYETSPFVVVFAYGESSIVAKGSVRRGVEYTEDDRKALAKARLASLKAEKLELNAEIEQATIEAVGAKAESTGAWKRLRL